MVRTEYCPHCRAITNLSASITLRTNPGPDGKMETLISRIYHCESCRSFIRSEDDELWRLNLDNFINVLSGKFL